MPISQSEGIHLNLTKLGIPSNVIVTLQMKGLGLEHMLWHTSLLTRMTNWDSNRNTFLYLHDVSSSVQCPLKPLSPPLYSIECQLPIWGNPEQVCTASSSMFFNVIMQYVVYNVHKMAEHCIHLFISILYSSSYLKSNITHQSTDTIVLRSQPQDSMCWENNFTGLEHKRQ